MAKASRPCRVLGCPELQPCPTHKPKPPPWKPAGRQRTSTAAWQRTRTAVLNRDSRRCYLCGNTANAVDHIVPAAEGGTDDHSNLAAICSTCHRRKTNAEAARGRARAREARRGGGVAPL